MTEVNRLCEEHNLKIAFLDGNHENFNRLKALPETDRYGNVVGRVTDNIFHLKRNHFYIIEDRRIYVLGGADSIDRGRRIENVSWWVDESITDEQVELTAKAFDLQKLDYFFSHEAPNNVKNALLNRYPENIIGGLGVVSLPSNEQMDRVQAVKAKSINKDTPWFFGHYHMDDDVELDGMKYGVLYEDVVEV